MKILGFMGLIAGLSVLTACGADFDPGSRVTSFRVLAQHADAPFAQPGETVSINALSYEPEGRTVNWAWVTCVNPPSSTVQGCFDKLGSDTQASGALPVAAQGPGLDTFTYTVPTEALDSLPAAARSGALVGVVSVACPGSLTFESGPGDLPVRCSDPDTGRVLGLDEYVVGLKRILVRSADRNQNPGIARVTFDHADWPEGEVKTVTACDSNGNTYSDCASSSKHDIGAYITDGSIESGQDEFGVHFDEQVVVEYYATEGIFDNSVRVAGDPETGWAARKKASGSDITLWFVVHDDRGGVIWVERTVHVD
jgi:hypothetical protein